MKNTGYFKNKKVTIVGLARSGLACANLLYALGARVKITEQKDNDLIRECVLNLKSADIKVELGGHTREFLQDSDIIVISPGVPEDALPIVWGNELKIPIIGEIEVGWLLCPATVIAVTGSNGKTTVTTLIGEILRKKGKRVYVCGNIGNPFCGEIEKMREGDFVSLEISSFQLEKIKTFKPKIAVFLNFSRNHLDRYKDMDEYLQAKKRIYLNQDNSDYLVLNSYDDVLKDLAGDTKAKVVFFCQQEGFNPNQSAVMEVGKLLGIEKEICLTVFKEFKGIEHRMEYVKEINNIKLINDSKATTVESAMWALETLSSPIILIAGGKHKGVDYRILADLARRKVKRLIVIGQAKGIIKDALQDSVPVEEALTLQEAVVAAFGCANSGDNVLLSPMCSSYDMFLDFQERGRVFKQIVFQLAQKAF